MIVFRGSQRPEYVRIEQVRAFLYATLMLLGYHNRYALLPLFVTFKKRIVNDGKLCDGTCQGSKIELRTGQDIEAMLTTCIHEVIHACIEFPDGTVEKNTSTLCARIKPDVARLAQVLVENTYQRAAYIAHTKIHYPAKNGDHYDDAQNDPIGVTEYRKGQPRRRRSIVP